MSIRSIKTHYHNRRSEIIKFPMPEDGDFALKDVDVGGFESVIESKLERGLSEDIESTIGDLVKRRADFVKSKLASTLDYESFEKVIENIEAFIWYCEVHLEAELNSVILHLKEIED